jgi:signal transduction histidine kinase
MFKKDAAERIPTDVNELVHDVLVLMHVELERSSIETKSVLTSGNAVEAMSLVTDRQAVLRIGSGSTEGGEVTISVEDSGPGIDPGNMDLIFEPFFTTKPKGMGMGLSNCRSIVEAHGGRLTVAPGRLHGTVFELVLPLPR